VSRLRWPDGWLGVVLRLAWYLAVIWAIAQGLEAPEGSFRYLGM